MEVIGIPQAFIYYKHPALFKTFFARLGFEILLSPKTNKKILERGVTLGENEACLPAKVFLGHLEWLINKKVDYLFIPRFLSFKKGLTSCPKFFALPDQTEAIFSHHPPILDPFINLNEKSLWQTFRQLGKKLGKNLFLVWQAYQQAKTAEKKEKKEKNIFFEKQLQTKKIKIVLVSHPYNLYDDFICASIVQLLNKMEVIPLNIDAVRPQKETVFFRWDFANEILASVKNLSCKFIDGAVQISSFNCGCDSVIKEFLQSEFASRKIPYLQLVIDEHTEKAGLITRLEAFIDTIKFQKGEKA